MANTELQKLKIKEIHMTRLAEMMRRIHTVEDTIIARMAFLRDDKEWDAQTAMLGILDTLISIAHEQRTFVLTKDTTAVIKLQG